MTTVKGYFVCNKCSKPIGADWNISESSFTKHVLTFNESAQIDFMENGTTYEIICKSCYDKRKKGRAENETK